MSGISTLRSFDRNINVAGAAGVASMAPVLHRDAPFPHNGAQGEKVGSAPSRTWRIALYSHDTMGLGHMRRNLLIAQTIVHSPVRASILMIAGAREASTLTLPPGTDCLTLPALRKELDRKYRARCLDVSLERLLALRAKAIRGAVEAFEPDLLIVDKEPRGALRELDATLEWVRMRRRTRCVLGLRDVLDEPAAVRREWQRAANEDAIRAYYDAVLVYGDPAVYDPAREYQFAPDVAAKVHYTGYLDQRLRLDRARPEHGDLLQDLGLPPGRLVLCMVGGGQDGVRVAEAFASVKLPPDTNAVLLTGPFMPRKVQQHLLCRAAGQPRLRVFEFVPEPSWLLRHADRVIAMGGYNTVCEVLSFEKRALIVPRVQPRREQLIRSERLRDLGLLDVLHPDEVNPQALTEWLTRDPGPPPQVHKRIDFHGAERLLQLLAHVFEMPPSQARNQPREERVQHV